MHALFDQSERRDFNPLITGVEDVLEDVVRHRALRARGADDGDGLRAEHGVDRDLADDLEIDADGDLIAQMLVQTRDTSSDVVGLSLYYPTSYDLAKYASDGTATWSRSLRRWSRCDRSVRSSKGSCRRR